MFEWLVTFQLSTGIILARLDHCWYLIASQWDEIWNRSDRTTHYHYFQNVLFCYTPRFWPLKIELNLSGMTVENRHVPFRLPLDVASHRSQGSSKTYTPWYHDRSHHIPIPGKKFLHVSWCHLCPYFRCLKNMDDSFYIYFNVLILNTLFYSVYFQGKALYLSVKKGYDKFHGNVKWT